MPSQKQRLIDALTRFARRNSGPLKRSAFLAHTRTTPDLIAKHCGGWIALLAAAGLTERAAYRRGVPDDALLAEFHRLSTTLGRPPTFKQLRATRFKHVIYQRRFRSSAGLAAAHARWCAANPSALRSRALSKPRPPGPISRAPAHGDPFAFRGLIAAPTNEAGVVHLFGALAQDLGIAILRYRNDFPDADALRRGPDGLWRPARIEFEFRSSNFARHKHDAAGCDLIICWTDDWPQSPVEVIELRSRIRATDRGSSAIGASPHPSTESPHPSSPRRGDRT